MIDEGGVRKRISEDCLQTLDARRICVIKPSALGDVVQSLPILAALKERFPTAEISWVINSELVAVLESHPHIDHLIKYHRRGSWRQTLGLLRTLRRKQFDLVFDLQGLARTGVMTAATRAGVRVGLESGREGSTAACHFLLRDTGRFVPAHLRYWRVAEALGLGNLHRTTQVTISDADRNWASKRLSKLRGPVLAVNPGARWVTKRWPIEHFAVIAAKAKRQYGFSTVILGGNSDRPAAQQLTQLLHRFTPSANIENLAGATTLKQLAAVLQSVDVMLSNDSGPLHLAAGLGTPVVGVFTCTDPGRSGCPGAEHELVTTSLSCASCYKKRCRYSGKKKMACLDEITTDRVWQSFQKLITRHARCQDAA